MGCTESKLQTSDVLPTNSLLSSQESSSVKSTVQHSARFLENFRVVWLYDHSSTKYDHDVKHLRTLLYGLKTFNNFDACYMFINEIHDERILLIVSGGTYRTTGRFHDLQQIEKIYLFDSSPKLIDTQNQIMKYQVIKNFENLHKQLDEDMKLGEIDLIPITTVSILANDNSIPSNLRKQQAAFLSAQMIKEILARFKFESSAKDIFIDFCQVHYMSSTEQLQIIDEFAKHYRPHNALIWLTNQSFIAKMLNHAGRTREIDVLYKLGFFVKQVNIQLNRLYNENLPEIETVSVVYRGKTMSFIEFDSTIKSNCGGFLSFPNFIITTMNKTAAIDFIRRRLAIHPSMTGILFEIHIEKGMFDEKCPFALLKDNDHVNDDLCFSMSTIFRIESLEQINIDGMMLWLVKLKLTNCYDQQLLEFLAPTRNDEIHANPGFYLGKLLLDMGDYKRGEQFLLVLMQDPAVLSQPRRLVRVYNGLAAIYAYNGEESKALEHYEQALKLSLTYLRSDHPDLLPIYKGIGDRYLNRNHYAHALENYEKAIESLKHGTTNMSADAIHDLYSCAETVKSLLGNSTSFCLV